MKKTIVLMIVVLFTLSACAGQVSEKPTVKIGVILPLSGSSAFLGEASQQAAELALKDLPENTKYGYELVFEDDQLVAAQTSKAINKLANVDDIDAVISYSSGSGNVVAPVAQENKILHIGIASDGNIAKTGNYNFLHWTPPYEEARYFIDELEKRGVKTIGVMALNQQGVEAVMVDVRRLAKEKGIVLYEERNNFGDKDFRTALLKLKEKNPDVYVLFEFSPELELVARQMDELGITAPRPTIESYDYTDQKQLFEGEWYVAGGEPTEMFRTEYMTAYAAEPQLGAGNIYDSIFLFVQAFETAGDGVTKPTPEEATQVLNNIKGFNGALGDGIYVGDDGIIWSPASLKKIENGEIVVIG